MHALAILNSTKNHPKYHLILFCLPLFFLFLAETAMGYLFPILIVENGLSNFLLGAIFSVSALFGLACDFFLPQFLKNYSWKWQFLLAIGFALALPLITLSGIVWKIPLFFLLASFCWYIYYELMLFAQQSFVVAEDKSKGFSQDWGFIFLTIQLASIVGPILASTFLTINSILALSLVIFLILISFTFALLSFPKTKSLVNVMNSHVETSFNLFKEFKYYQVFVQRILPLLALAILMIFVSEMFWNFGGLFGEEYQVQIGTGWMVMTAFSLPLIFGPLFLTKVKIKKGKKKLSLIFAIVSGLVLSLIFFTRNYYLILVIILTSSIFASFVTPLYEAVFSDLLGRLGENRLHLLSLIRFSSSISYLISPVITGLIADSIGYKLMFSSVGLVSAFLAFVILLLMPKKIKLPQRALETIS